MNSPMFDRSNADVPPRRCPSVLQILYYCVVGPLAFLIDAMALLFQACGMSDRTSYKGATFCVGYCCYVAFNLAHNFYSAFRYGFNNNNKLQNFCDALTLVEDDRWYTFVVCSICEISGQPLESIQIIFADMKLSEHLFRSYLPGKDYVVCHHNQIMLHRF